MHTPAPESCFDAFCFNSFASTWSLHGPESIAIDAGNNAPHNIASDTFT